MFRGNSRPARRVNLSTKRDATSFLRLIEASTISGKSILPTARLCSKTEVGYLKFMTMEVTRAEGPSSDNLCRYAAYPEVLDAVRLASPEMEGATFHLAVEKTATRRFCDDWVAP